MTSSRFPGAAVLPLLAAGLALLVGCGDGGASTGGLPDAGPPSPDAWSPPPADGSTTFDASSCLPGDVSTFQPPSYRPATPVYQGRCTADVLGAAWAACSSPTDSSCVTWRAANADCAACLFSKDTAPRFGPSIVRRGYLEVNVAGCLELRGGAAGLSCAKAVQASDACTAEACSANCPVTGPPSLDAFERCVDIAGGSGCAAFAQKAKCAEAVSTVPAGICVRGATAEQRFRDIASLFCGPPPILDAGGGG